MPELKSVEVGPTGRFYAGSPSVVNKTSQSLGRVFDSVNVTNSNSCNLSYQISNDEFSFYYWNGTGWQTGSDVSESNDLETLNSNLDPFFDHLGLGEIYLRVYLGNSNFSECELDAFKIY